MNLFLPKINMQSKNFEEQFSLLTRKHNLNISNVLPHNTNNTTNNINKNLSTTLRQNSKIPHNCFRKTFSGDTFKVSHNGQIPCYFDVLEKFENFTLNLEIQCKFR